MLLIWQALGFPEVEDPIPERIGLESLIALAGAGGLMGGILSFGAPPRKRERAVSLGGLLGFCAGLGIYALSLVVQVISDQ